MTAYGSRPSREHAPAAPILADDLSQACLRVSRAQDGRTFACARPAGHNGARSGAGCYGRDRSGAVRLGYGAGAY